MRKTIAREIEKIMETNEDIIFLFGDLGFSLFDNLRKKFPERTFNAGVSEQAMISIAAGLAKTGKIPIVYSIIPFLIYRPFEQILLDVAYHNLPVIFIGSSEGFSYGEEGVSHFALHDLGLILQLPTIDVYTPAESNEAKEYLLEAVENKKPAYIRLSKMNEPSFKTNVERKKGYSILFAESKVEVNILSVGGISLEVEKILEDIKKLNKKIGVFHIGKLRPLNIEIKNKITGCEKNILIEEHYEVGGVASYLSTLLKQRIDTISIKNPFTTQVGKREYMLNKNFIDKEGIYNRLKEIIGVKK